MGFWDLEGKYEANEVVVQKLMRSNIEGSLKVHACHLRIGQTGLIVAPGWNRWQFLEQSWLSAGFPFPHCGTPIVGPAEQRVSINFYSDNKTLAWPQVFSPMAMGWMARKSGSWVVLVEKKTDLTCCVDLGVPWARVELIWDTVAVVVPEASVSCSIMVVVHLLWICDKWAVVLKVWNSVVVSIWITVVANAILVGIQLVGVVGIRAVVILVRNPI